MKNGKKLLSFILIALSSVFCIGSLNLKPSAPSYAANTTKVAPIYTANSLNTGDILSFGEYPQTAISLSLYTSNQSKFKKDENYEQNGYWVAMQDIAGGAIKRGEKIFILDLYQNYDEKYPYAEFRDGYKSGRTFARSSNLDPRKYVDDVGSKDGYKQVSTSVTKQGKNNDYYSLSTKYAFKVEPLKWKITSTSDGTITMSCINVVDAMDFNLFDSNGTNWAYSYLRNWLNAGSGYNNKQIGVAYNVENSTNGNRVYTKKGEWYSSNYYDSWFDYNDYGFGYSSYYKQGSRNSVLVNSSSLYNSGSFFLRAFNSAEREVVLKQKRAAYGTIPSGKLNYLWRNNGEDLIQVEDYVTLITGETGTAKRNITGYTDYAIANGFVSDFGSSTEANSTERTRGGNCGYIWTMYNDEKEFGDQWSVKNMSGNICTHNIREVVQVNFSSRNTKWCGYGSTSGSRDNIKELDYKVNAMDQSYGVVPQIKISTSTLRYLNRIDEAGLVNTNSENYIKTSKSGTNREFTIGDFDRKILDYYVEWGNSSGVTVGPSIPKVDLSSAVKTNTGYKVTAKLINSSEPDISIDGSTSKASIPDYCYVKIIISPTKLDTASYAHDINTSTKYIYIKGSEITEESFSFDVTTTAGVRNLYVYAFICDEDLKHTYALEDATQENSLANLRYDTINFVRLDSNGNEESRTTQALFKGMNFTLDKVEIGNGQSGYWFTDVEKAKDFAKNPDASNGSTPEGGIPWTEEEVEKGYKTMTFDGSVTTYYSIAGTLSHGVSIVNADNSYYFKYNKMSIYPGVSSSGSTIIEKISSAYNTQLILVIKYPYINSYIIENGENREFKNPKISVLTTDGYKEGVEYVTVDNVDAKLFSGSLSEIKEIEYTLTFKNAGKPETLMFKVLGPDGVKPTENTYNINFNYTGEEKAKFGTATIGGVETDVNSTTISGISYGKSVTSDLKFNTGYYIPPTTKYGELGLNIPKMSFSYAGIIRDKNGYRYADGVTYTDGVYAGQKVRIDNTGAGINFDGNENRKYYLTYTSTTAGVTGLTGLGLDKKPDGSYVGIDENKTSGFVFKPIYSVYINGATTPIEIDSTIVSATEGNTYTLQLDGINAYVLKVLGKDSVSFTKANATGSTVVNDADYYFSSIKISTYADEVGKTLRGGNEYTAVVKVKYAVFALIDGEDVTETEILKHRVGDANTVAKFDTSSLYNYELEYETSEGNVNRYELSITSSTTKYYNPWVEYVKDVVIVVNGNQYDETGNIFMSFKGKDIWTGNLSTGMSNITAWTGNKMWFYSNGSEIVQLTSFRNSIPCIENGPVAELDIYGLGKITINGKEYEVFSIDGVDIKITYNVNTNAIGINYTFDFVASNIQFGFSGVSEYDYSVKFISTANGKSGSAASYAEGQELIVNNKSSELKNKETKFPVGTSFDFTSIPNLRSYVNGYINGESVMVFTPITIGSIDYYLCSGGDGWTIESNNGSYIEYTVIYGGDELIAYKLVNGSDSVYIQKPKNTASFFGSAKELVGFELANPADATKLVDVDGKQIVAAGKTTDNRSYYTFTQILNTTYVFSDTFSSITFIAVYDTCSINVKIDGWAAGREEYNLIEEYLSKNQTEEEAFKVVKTYDAEGHVRNSEYYLKDTLYNTVITSEQVSDAGSLVTFAQNFANDNGQITKDYGTFKGFFRRTYGAIEMAASAGLLYRDSGSTNYLVNASSYLPVTLNGVVMYVKNNDGEANYNSTIYRVVLDYDGFVSDVTAYELFTSGEAGEGGTRFKSNNVELVTLFEVKLYSVTSKFTEKQLNALIVNENNVSTVLSGVVTGQNLQLTYTLQDAYTHTDLSTQFRVTVGGTAISMVSYTIDENGEMKFTDGGYALVIDGNQYKVVIAAQSVVANIEVSLKKTGESDFEFVANKYDIVVNDPTLTKVNNSGISYNLGAFSGEVASGVVSKQTYGNTTTITFTIDNAFKTSGYKFNVFVAQDDEETPIESAEWVSGKLSLAKGNRISINDITFVVDSLGQVYTIKIQSGVTRAIRFEFDEECINDISFKQYSPIHTTVAGVDYSTNTTDNELKKAPDGKDNIAKTVYASTFVYGSEDTAVTRDGKLANNDRARMLYGDKIKYTVALTDGYTDGFVVFNINNNYIIPFGKLTRLSETNKDLVLNNGRGTSVTINITSITSNAITYTIGSDATTSVTITKDSETEYTITQRSQIAKLTIAGGTYTLSFSANFAEKGDSNLLVYAEQYKLTSASGNDVTVNSRNKYTEDLKNLIIADDQPNEWQFNDVKISNSNQQTTAFYGDYVALKFKPSPTYTHNLPVFSNGTTLFYIAGMGVDYSEHGVTFYDNHYYLNRNNDGDYVYRIDKTFNTTGLSSATYTLSYYNPQDVLLLKITINAYLFKGFDDYYQDFTIGECEKFEPGTTYTFEYLVKSGDDSIQDGNTNYELNKYTVAFVKRVLVDVSKNKYENRGTVKYTEDGKLTPYLVKVVYNETFKNPYSLGISNFGQEEGYTYSNEDKWYDFTNGNYTEYMFSGSDSQSVTGHMVLSATYTENIYNMVFAKPSQNTGDYKEYGVLRSNLTADHTFNNKGDINLNFTENTITYKIYHSKVKGLSFGFYVYAGYDQTLPIFNIGYNGKVIKIYMPGDTNAGEPDEKGVYSYTCDGIIITITPTADSTGAFYNYTYDGKQFLSLRVIKNADVARELNHKNSSYANNALSTYYNVWFTTEILGMTTNSSVNISVEGFSELNKYSLTLKDMNMEVVGEKNYNLVNDYSDYTTTDYTKVYTHGATLEKLPTIEVARGYKFANWGLDDKFEKTTAYPYTALYSNTVLYPKFTVNTSKLQVYGNGGIFINDQKASALIIDGITIGSIRFGDGTIAEKTVSYTDETVFRVTINRQYTKNEFKFSLRSSTNAPVDNNVVLNVSEPEKNKQNDGYEYVYTITVKYFDSNQRAYLQVENNNVVSNRYTLQFYVPTAIDYETMGVTIDKLSGGEFEITHGTALSSQGRQLPDDPKFEGWTFKGWYVAEASDVASWFNETNSPVAGKFTANTNVYYDTNVYAYFTRDIYYAKIVPYCYELGEKGISKFIDGTYNLVDDAVNPKFTYPVSYNGVLDRIDTLFIPTSSFEFDKYYYVTDLADIGTEKMKEFKVNETLVVGDIYVIANYTRKTFTVRFYNQSYAEYVSYTGIYYGDSITIPTYDPTIVAPGYHFEYWYSSGVAKLTEDFIVKNDIDFSPFVAANKYLFAFKYENGEVGTVGDEFNSHPDYYVDGIYNLSIFDGENVVVPFTSTLMFKFAPSFGYNLYKPNVVVKIVRNGVTLGSIGVGPTIEYDEENNKYNITLGSNLLKSATIDGEEIKFEDGDQFVIETTGIVNDYYIKTVTNSGPIQGTGNEAYSFGITSNNRPYGYITEGGVQIFTINLSNADGKNTNIIHGENAKIAVKVNNSFNYKSVIRFSITDGITTKHIMIKDRNSDATGEGYTICHLEKQNDEWVAEFLFEEVRGMLSVTLEETSIINNDYTIKFHMAFGGGVNAWYRRQVFENALAKYESGYVVDNFAEYFVPSPNVVTPNIDNVSSEQYSGSYVWCYNPWWDNHQTKWYMANNDAINWDDVTRDNYLSYFTPVDAGTKFSANTDLYTFYFINTVTVGVESKEGAKGAFTATSTADMHDPSATDMAGYAYAFDYTVNIAYSNNIPVISVIGERDSYDVVILPYSTYMRMTVGQTVTVSKNETENYIITITANGYSYYKQGQAVSMATKVVYANGVYSVSETPEGGTEYTKYTVTPNGNNYRICLNKVDQNFSLASNESTYTINTYSVVYTTPNGEKHLEEVRYGEKVVNIPEVSANFLQKVVYVVKHANGKTETVSAKTLKAIEFTQDATIEIKVETNVVIVVLIAVAGAVVIGLIITLIIKAKNSHNTRKRVSKENKEMFERLAQDKQQNNDEHGPRI